jgi:hypothetical protein
LRFFFGDVEIEIREKARKEEVACVWRQVQTRIRSYVFYVSAGEARLARVRPTLPSTAGSWLDI